MQNILILFLGIFSYKCTFLFFNVIFSSLRLFFVVFYNVEHFSQILDFRTSVKPKFGNKF
jgi:hypothetical protein